MLDGVGLTCADDKITLLWKLLILLSSRVTQLPGKDRFLES